MARLLIFLALISVVSAVEWQCGVGKVSQMFSLSLVPKGAVDEVNYCCLAHDKEIHTVETIGPAPDFWAYLNRKKAGINRKVADENFCTCLSDIENVYIQWVIKPLFCATVKAYSQVTKWLE